MGRTVRAARGALLALGCALLAGGPSGCAGGGGGGTTQPACKSQVPGNPISFANNIQPIFNRSCALAGCHIPPTLNGGQDLSAGRAYRATVNAKSQQKPRVLRVKPGDPDNSYLFQKIVGTPGIAGVLMPQGCPGTPLNGATCLTPDEIDAIRTWILECAPNN